MKTTVVLGLMLMGLGSSTAQEVVTLRDGTVFENAAIARLSQATYIVQTENELFEFSEDELAAETLAEHDFRGKRTPIITRHYDEVHADGTATSHWTLPLENTGRKAMTEIRMGLARWERAMVDQRTFVDGNGARLESVYDPPREKWEDVPDKIIRHILKLRVPLAPGESMTFTGSETSNRIQETEEGYHYRFHGDYSEDRFVTLKVRLPQGATIRRVAPAPSARFEHEDSVYLVWRHYYKKGDVYPFDVVYTLN